MQLQNKQSPWRTIMTIEFKKKRKKKKETQNKQTNKND